MLKDNCLAFRRDLRMWLYKRKWTLSYDLLLSFWRYKQIEMRPAITLILKEGNIWKAPKIQIVALLCILFSSLKGYNNRALL